MGSNKNETVNGENSINRKKILYMFGGLLVALSLIAGVYANSLGQEEKYVKEALSIFEDLARDTSQYLKVYEKTMWQHVVDPEAFILLNRAEPIVERAKKIKPPSNKAYQNHHFNANIILERDYSKALDDLDRATRSGQSILYESSYLELEKSIDALFESFVENIVEEWLRNYGDLPADMEFFDVWEQSPFNSNELYNALIMGWRKVY